MGGTAWRWMKAHWQDLVYDAVPPLVLLTVGLLDAATGTLSEPIGTAPALTALIPSTLACLVLLLRRHRPLLVLAVVLIAALVPPLIMPTALTYWDEFVVWLLALYSCARHLPRRGALAGLCMSLAGLVLLPAEFQEMRDPGSVVFNAFLLAGAFTVGLLARSWSGYRERTFRALLEQAAAAERAVAQERGRIARELHDVISHTITVIVMQAGGARLASQADPGIALKALAQIEELGRTSLGELRTLLPLLGTGEGTGGDGEGTGGSNPAGRLADIAAAAAGTTGAEELAPTPQPTMADVGSLCERMRHIGLPVELLADGAAANLPPGMQLTAYRVVQEGLTNVIRHAGRSPATVRIAVQARGHGGGRLLSIEVENRIADTDRHTPGSRRGLRGLEERVRLTGGQLMAGPTGTGGFLLSVQLPVVEVSA